jgi:hypothetical protein
MLPEDDPGWGTYAETILRFRGTPAIEINLSQPVTPAQRAALAQAGLDRPFGLVTPCNPRGRRSDDVANAGRLGRFLADLDAAGEAYVRVDGCSPDGSHVEPGVAVAWPRESILALARRWDQSAIYWWDGTHFWVVGALTAAPPWQLGGAA